MIKDFNAFITEDKEYNEIFTLVEEVLSNEYSDQEIEESFDEFNLLLESLSDENIKILQKLFGFYKNWKSQWEIEGADLERMAKILNK